MSNGSNDQRRDIDGTGRTVWEMFNNRRYSIDSYQREYKWQTKQIGELLDDLAEKFLENYEPGQERSAVARYGHYFLGSVVLSQKEGESYVIDGQQRLTTLTLLLIYLNHRQKDLPEDNQIELESLILSKKWGKKTFNLDEPERATCLEYLFRGEPFEPTAKDSEAVRNMVARYKDIESSFSPEIDDEALPYYLDWLLNNVHLVEIMTFSQDDAYTIFETMNDRGLSLAPLDMLKGYVIANIEGDENRERINSHWKKSTNALLELEKEEPADAVKAWLRSQYAETTRERKKGALPGDFDRIGTEFHRWVQKHADQPIGLRKSADYIRFVERDFEFYTEHYRQIRLASRWPKAGLEVINYIAWLGTLQYPLLLAPLLNSDSPDIIERKLKVVGSYVDILLARRLWNFRSIAYSTMQYAIFTVMREIRRKSLDELVAILCKRLDTADETFDSVEAFRMHQQNRFLVHWLLARLTDWVGVQTGRASRFMEYMSEGRNRYEIEHIWANHWQQHDDEFGHEVDFAAYRNRIGGLLLLPKSFNASYGDLPYEEKFPHYLKQDNLLVQSLHPNAYNMDPQFSQFLSRTGLPFQPHQQFKKVDLDARQQLYAALAKQVWNPSRLEQAAQ